MGFQHTDSSGDELPPPFDDVEPGFDPLSSVSLSPTYDVERWDELNKIVELGGDIEYDEETEKLLWALRHFTLRIAPACDEIVDWDALDQRTQRMYRAGVAKQFVGGYRELEALLERGGPVAREAGFAPRDGTSYSTLSGAISDFDAEFLARAARYSRNAALYALTTRGRSFDRAHVYPSKPRAYHLENGEEWTVSMDEKLDQASKILAKYMALVAPCLRFDRDRFAPNYRYSVGDIYRLFAHLAIEQCAAKNGAELLDWLSPYDTPSASTLSAYIPRPGTPEGYEVEKLEQRFIDATCRLLNRETLGFSSPTHLAFDLTAVGWYGDEHRWVTGSIKKDNTTNFWHYAVLSTVSPGKNYILAVTPIKERSEKAEALDRMLRSLRETDSFEFGRIYMDSQLFQADIVTTCRNHDLRWMIQAPETKAYSKMAKHAVPGEPDKVTGLTFTAFTAESQRFNALIAPIPEEEVGQRQTTPNTKVTRDPDSISVTDVPWHSSSQTTDSDTSHNGPLDRWATNVPPTETTPDTASDVETGNGTTHTVWITDLDVETRDIEGLSYQYRNRWKIETAIRQLKHTFQGECRSSNRLARTVYFGAAQLFYNFWVALNHELPYHLGDPAGFRLTGLEMLHAFRQADFSQGATGNNLFI